MSAEPTGPADAYTVVGVWLAGEPVPVGVIEGRHGVSGGDFGVFPDGLWASWVSAADIPGAEAAAVADMTDAANT